RIARPRGLIGYDTITKQQAVGRAVAPLRLVRARTLLYASLICLVAIVMLTALLQRNVLEINALHDRNPSYVLLSDGSIRNGYTVKILNKLHQSREFLLETRGLAGARLNIIGTDAGARIRVGTDDLRELRVLVTVPASQIHELPHDSVEFALIVRDEASGHATARATHFQRPPGGTSP